MCKNGERKKLEYFKQNFVRKLKSEIEKIKLRNNRTRSRKLFVFVFETLESAFFLKKNNLLIVIQVATSQEGRQLEIYSDSPKVEGQCSLPSHVQTCQDRLSGCAK